MTPRIAMRAPALPGQPRQPLPRRPLLPRLALCVMPLVTGCGAGDGGVPDDAASPAAEEGRGAGVDGQESPTAAALRETLARSVALADSMEDLLRPVPLMRPAQEAALKRSSNAQNVARARELGVRPGNDAELESLVAEGRLVALGDSTRHWVLRDMASHAYVTPDMRRLLERIGERFHERLAGMGLPPLRFEISSALRTAEGQAALRRRNVNAAAGTSAHEFGTTVDIPYSGYAAPAELPVPVPDDAPASMRPDLERVAREVVERMAARKSRELKAILGEVMRETQAAGEVLVTLEELQPVYHITIARPM